jgi:hypothetical protein
LKLTKAFLASLGRPFAAYRQGRYVAAGALMDEGEGFSLLRGFAEAVFSIVRGSLTKTPMAERRRRVAKFLSGPDWTHEELVEKDLFGHLRAHHSLEEIWGLPASDAVARWYHAHPEIPGVRTTGVYQKPYADTSRSFIVNDLICTIEDYVKRGGSVDAIDDDLLRSSWREVSALWNAPRVNVHYLVAGVTVETTLDLGRFGLLRPLSEDDKTTKVRLHDWDLGPCPISEAALSKTELVPAKEGLSLNEAIPPVMTALRLRSGTDIFGRGPVLTPISTRVPTGFAYSTITDFAPPPREAHEWWRSHSIGEHKLLPSDVTELIDLCSILHDSALRVFPVGFRRFNHSLRRLLVEDRIVDLAISLESTLLAGVDGELGWRAQVLAAELLRGRRDPSDVKTRIRALYSARSKIVHEGVDLEREFSTSSSKSKDWRRVAPSAAAFDGAMVEIMRSLLLETARQSGGLKGPQDLRTGLEDRIILGTSSKAGTA